MLSKPMSSPHQGVLQRHPRYGCFIVQYGRLICVAFAIAWAFSPAATGATLLEQSFSIADQTGTYGSPFCFIAPPKTFAGIDARRILNYSASGLPPGIALNPGTLTLSGTPKLAGTYAVQIVATEKGTSASRRAIASFKFTVNKAPLTITADNKIKAYGGTFPLLTATYEGFIDGDTSASLATPGAFSTTATPASPVGVYPITINGTMDANYSIKFVPGTLRVTPSNLRFASQNENEVSRAALTH
jgi:hypothetical protein